jgi:hypothetical protein
MTQLPFKMVKHSYMECLLFHGTLAEGGRINTVDLLVKIARFVKSK